MNHMAALLAWDWSRADQLTHTGQSELFLGAQVGVVKVKVIWGAVGGHGPP